MTTTGRPPMLGVVRPDQKHRYVMGIAYRHLIDDDGRPRKMSVQASHALEILNAPDDRVDTKVRAQARHQLYHDPSVRLQKSVAERHSLAGYPIYREHDRSAPPIGEILHSHVDGSELRIFARISDPAVVADIDAGTLPDFSIGYDFAFDALGHLETPIKEVSLTQRGFFDGTRVLGVCAHNGGSGGGAAAGGNKSAQYIERAGPLGSHSAVGTFRTQHLLVDPPSAAMSTPKSTSQTPDNAGQPDLAALMERIASLEKEKSTLAQQAQSATKRAQTLQAKYAEEKAENLKGVLALFQGEPAEEGGAPPPLPQELENALTNFMTNPEYSDTARQLTNLTERIGNLKKEHLEYKTSLETEKTAFDEYKQQVEGEKEDDDAASGTPDLSEMHQPTHEAQKRQREWQQTTQDAMKMAGGIPGNLSFNGQEVPMQTMGSVNASAAGRPAKRARTDISGPFDTPEKNLFMQQLTQLKANNSYDIRNEPASLHKRD